MGESSHTRRYVCRLDVDALSIASRELSEPLENYERLAMIDRLQYAFHENSDLPLFSNDDSFLLMFLRARKFNIPNALLMLINYHERKLSWPEVFDLVKFPNLIKNVFKTGSIVQLDRTALDGSTIIVTRPGKVENAVLLEFIASIVLTLETALKKETTQVYGVTVIQDFSYFKMPLLYQCQPYVLTKFLSIVQDCMPVRLKSLHIVNEPKALTILYKIVKPLLSETLKRRLHLHGQNFEGLWCTIPQTVLPLCLGGTGPELNEDFVTHWANLVCDEELSIE